ncbi:MAG: hypothetical protein AAFP93_03120, partial [Bacteroidota bacterium]
MKHTISKRFLITPSLLIYLLFACRDSQAILDAKNETQSPVHLSEEAGRDSDINRVEGDLEDIRVITEWFAKDKSYDSKAVKDLPSAPVAPNHFAELDDLDIGDLRTCQQALEAFIKKHGSQKEIECSIEDCQSEVDSLVLLKKVADIPRLKDLPEYSSPPSPSNSACLSPSNTARHRERSESDMLKALDEQMKDLRKAVDALEEYKLAEGALSPLSGSSSPRFLLEAGEALSPKNITTSKLQETEELPDSFNIASELQEFQQLLLLKQQTLDKLLWLQNA